jgi:uncharacterized DUF497 family protein
VPGLWIEDLFVEEHVEEKLAVKHGLTMDEVWDACTEGEPRIERAREGLYLALGTTAGGRYVAVVLAHLGGGDWQVVTARDMNDAERRRFQGR